MLFALWPLGLLADSTNTWHFTNAAQYSVSAPAYAEINTNAPGYAQLVLQAQSVYHTTLADWTSGQAWSLLNFGPDLAVRLSGTPGAYASSGTFTSRIFDGGSGVRWDMLQFRASNRDYFWDPALVALYKMDNDNWRDAVTGGSGTPVGSPTFTVNARIGSHAGDFSGAANNYVTTLNGGLLNGKSACTIAYWFYQRSNKPASGHVVSYGTRYNGIREWGANSLQLIIMTTLGQSIPTVAFSSGRWYFLVLAWQATPAGDGKAKAYVDGTLVSEGPAIGGTIIQDDYFKIGVDDADVGARCLNGIIDEVAIWKRALSSSEVAVLYKSYAITYPLRFQVRSGTSQADALTKVFVGPDATPDTYYLASAERLISCSDFSVSNQFVQYCAYLLSSTNNYLTPYVEAAGFIDQNNTPYFDNVLFDLQRGQYTSNTTYIPEDKDTPYLGLTVKENGGYPTNGAYVSRVLDGGASVTWGVIQGDLGQELSASIPGLVELWHLNDTTWAPAKGVVLYGAGTAAVTPLAKLGNGSAVFSDAAATHVLFPVAKSVRAIEFWVDAETVNDGLADIRYGTTSHVFITLSNRMIAVSGPAGTVPSVIVNGNDQSPRLLSGWNHVCISLQNALVVDDVDLGVAAGDYFKGKMDELALYDRVVTRAEAKAHYVSGRRGVAGRIQVQAKAWTPPALPPASFGPLGANGQNVGLVGRYLQYRLVLEGDGDGTPAVNSVTVNHNGAGSPLVDDTRDEIVQGTFESGLTGWYGDEVKLDELGSMGPLNLKLAFDATDPLALYHFDESSWPGPATILDAKRGVSGNGSPASGATVSPGSAVGPYCGSFDGVDDFAALGGGINQPGDLTIGAWFSTFSTNRGVVISSDDGNSYYTVEVNGNGTGPDAEKVTFLISDGLPARERYVTASRVGLNDGRWHHVAGCRRGSQLHIYIDGDRVGTADIGLFYGGVGLGAPYVGKRGISGTPSFFKGLVDEVAIWDRALSEAEIGQLAGGAFRTQGTGEYVSTVITNAAGPAIWQTMFWMTDGPYSKPLSGSDATLAALWRMEDTGAGSAVTNLLAGNNGTFSGTGWGAAGRFDKCLDFNGSGDAVTVTHNAGLPLTPAAITVEAWVNMDEVIGRAVVDKLSGNGYLLATDTNGIPYFRVAGTTCSGYLPIRAGKWTHLAGTYESPFLKLYVDGELAGVVDAVGLFTTVAVDLFIGKNQGASGYFDGRIDEVAIHSRALRAGEIFDHYRAGAMTLKLQARSANNPAFPGVDFVGPGKVTNTYFTASLAEDMVGDVDLAQYFQYRAYFATENCRLTPRLSGVKVFVSSYPITHPTVEPLAGSGFAFVGNLLGFNHTATFVPPNSGVQYQISGDGGASPRWFYWNGSQWATNSGPDVYGATTSDRDTINARIRSFYDQLYPTAGGLFRFKAFLHSLGDQQIAVDKVDLVASEGRIVVTVPNGTENGNLAWIAGVPYDIAWTWVGKVSTNLVVEYSTTGQDTNPAAWTQITNAAPRGAGGAGSLTWLVPQLALATNCIVRVRDPSDATVWDWSDSAFTIVQRFRIIANNGGVRWYAGKTTNIVWESPYDASTVVEIDYAPDGTNYNLAYRIDSIAGNVNGSKTNSRPWTPSVAYLSTGARLRIQTAGLGEYADESDSTFELAGIEVTQPDAGPPKRKVKRNDPFTITWRSVGAGAAVAIDLSSDGGSTYTNIYASVPNVLGTNSYMWNVTQDGTDRAVLRIRSLSDPNVEGYSAEFTLADIDVTAPDGGEVWLMDTTTNITWTSGGAGATVNIDFSTNSGAGGWMPIATAVTNSGSYAWTVSRLVSRKARVRVVSAGSADSDTNLWSMSAADFNIAGVRVTYPDKSSDQLQRNVPTFVRHDGAPAAWNADGVTLEISYDATNTFSLLGPGADHYGLGSPFPFTPVYPTTRARIRATLNNPTPYTNVWDLSDEDFTVAGVLVLYPTNNSVLNIGDTYQVRWVSAGAPVAAKAFISYSNQGTNNFLNLTPLGYNNNQVYPGQNTYDWTVAPTLLPSTNARIQVAVGTNYTDVSAAYTLRGIRITSPNTGTVANAWTDQSIAWVYAGIDKSATIGLSLSTDGGASFPYEITNSYALSTTVYPWYGVEHPPYDPTTNAVIRMRVLASPKTEDTNVVAYSDAFVLRGIKVKSPLAGEGWQIGSTNSIVFVAARAGATAAITYSPNGGGSYDVALVASSLAIVDGSNTYSWTIEQSRQPSVTARLKVAGTGATGYSPLFTVGGVRVDQPNQNSIWAVGQTNSISWISVGTQGTNLIELIYVGAPYTNYIIAPAYSGGTTLNWLMPSNAIPGGLDTISNVVLRVRDTGGYEGSSQPFKLVSTPRIEIISPAAGEFWKVGETKTIQWLKGGQMAATDFRIYYLRNGVIEGEVTGGTPSFDPALNVYSMNWVIPDLLGTKTILVTNQVNALVYDTSGAFDVCGNLRVIYPNGVQPEQDLYALDTVSASWGTRGNVTNVDLYYRYGSAPWTKIATRLVNRTLPSGEDFTSASWLVPDLQTATARFRVQDSNYTNIFDGVTPGPYDDSDADFEIKYYTIYWDVYYVDSQGRSNRLNRLSVTDSSGWSQAGLSCLDAGGLPQLIVRKYPYGIYDTVWYREFFHDKVDFHWLCNTNQTRLVRMTAAEVEPEYHVMANFAYSITNSTFTINSWLERNGAILQDPSSNSITIYTNNGVRIDSLSAHVATNGVFWQTWNATNAAARLGVTFTPLDVFFARVSITYADVEYSSGLTFAMRLAAGEETVSAISAIVAGMKTDIMAGLTNINLNVSNVGSNLNAFRGETAGGISNLMSLGISTTNLLGTLAADVGGITNALGPKLDQLTNQVSFLGPALSNLTASVTNLQADMVSDRARILTRPTSIEYGTTNVFLYKTRPGYGSGTVRIRVRTEAGVEIQAADMAEVVGGIYQQDLVANWGTNSYIILCTDPMASDSMIVKVTGGGALDTVPGQIAALGAQLNLLQTSVTNIETVVGGIPALDTQLGQMQIVVTNLQSQIMSLAALSNQMGVIAGAITNIPSQAGVSNQLVQIRTTVTNIQNAVSGIRNVDLTGVMTELGTIETVVRGFQGVDLSGITRLEQQIGRVSDGGSQNTFFGKLSSLSSQISSAGTAASDAAKKAQTAKTEAATAASGIQGLKGEIAKGDLQGAIARLEEIKSSLGSAQQNLVEIPKLVRIAGLTDSLSRMTGQFQELAQSKGWKYLVNLEEPKGSEPGEPAEGVDAEAIDQLNSNIEEVRSSMLFMQKLMESQRDQPVIQEELVAAP